MADKITRISNPLADPQPCGSHVYRKGSYVPCTQTARWLKNGKPTCTVHAGKRGSTPDQRREAARLYLDRGFTLLEIAEHYHLTIPAIRGWLTQYCFAPGCSHTRLNHDHVLPDSPCRQCTCNTFSPIALRSGAQSTSTKAARAAELRRMHRETDGDAALWLPALPDWACECKGTCPCHTPEADA